MKKLPYTFLYPFLPPYSGYAERKGFSIMRDFQFDKLNPVLPIEMKEYLRKRVIEVYYAEG